MFIHPQKWVSNVDQKCVQPNAIDIRINELFRINTDELLILKDKESPVHRRRNPVPLSSGNTFKLHAGVYQFETKHYVEMPEGCAGYLIARSSLNRNGVFILSGLYDSGFKNYIGGTLYTTGPVEIEHNARIAQFCMVSAETVNMYSGQYNIKENSNGN